MDSLFLLSFSFPSFLPGDGGEGCFRGTVNRNRGFPDGYMRGMARGISNMRKILDNKITAFEDEIPKEVAANCPISMFASFGAD